MKNVIRVCVVFVVVVIIAVFALVPIFHSEKNKHNPFKCYNCMHIKGDSFHDFDGISDDSCEEGRVMRMPKRLSVNCYDTVKTHEGMSDQLSYLINALEANPSNTSRIIPIFTCAKLKLTGKVRGESVRTTVRTCIPTSRWIHAFKEECTENKLSAVTASMDDEVALFLSNFSSLFGDNATANICTCNGDNCNSGNSAYNIGLQTIILQVGCIFIAYFMCL